MSWKRAFLLWALVGAAIVTLASLAIEFVELGRPAYEVAHDLFVRRAQAEGFTAEQAEALFAVFLVQESSSEGGG